MRIGIAYDLAPDHKPPDGPDDRYEEFDKPETIEALAEVLRGEGHEIVLLGDGREFLGKALADPPDLVWNLAEGEGVGRCREARVPAVLEMLKIPCTGSDPLTLAATLDKTVAKTLVAPFLSAPRSLTVWPGSLPDLTHSSVRSGACGPGPWIVKPAFEGSSKGIRQNCLVDSPGEAVQLGFDQCQLWAADLDRGVHRGG